MGLRRGLVLAVLFATASADIAVAAACPDRLVTSSDLAQCSSAAVGGDPDAALALGTAMADVSSRFYDPAAAAAWWEAAAEAGRPQALRRLFDVYWYGHGLSRDQPRARGYLDQAVRLGAPWSRLVLAVLMEDESRGEAAELYTRLAEDGNCLAQLRLAHGYDRGGWVEKNPSQALFWTLVAARTSVGRDKVDGHPLFESRFHYGDCATEAYFLKGEVGRGLASDLRAKVTLAAENWRPGRAPDRPGPVEVAAAPGVAPVIGRSGGRGGESRGAAGAGLRPWAPLPQALRRSPGQGHLDAEAVFAMVERSVHVVVAARSDEDVKLSRVRFGSAVALDERTLLTNCHVIAEMPVIWLRKGEQMLRATPSAGDDVTDRCLLTVSPARLSAVPGVRSWDDLKVGETVYSIGSPKGLEATLGQGLVSGLRAIRGLRYVQTSAPISPGSSGGGLFDASGNLVGITSFQIRDADGLNFAIAADEYFR